MSVNKFNLRPHVLVLPEDDANRQIATGFAVNLIEGRDYKVLEVAGGWPKVRELFFEVHVAEMQRCAQRYMVLLVDFDGKESRLAEMTKDIPDALADRVFVIGIWTEPEDLYRHGLGTEENFGRQLASECHENQSDLWNHELLIHNANELDRMKVKLRPILFPSA